MDFSLHIDFISGNCLFLMVDEMKEIGRSEHSEAVANTKSSSGCLIIKKKAAYGEGVGGFSDSSSRSLFNSTKERKRPRLVLGDSESSSDELSETLNGSVRGLIENKEIQIEERVNNGLDDELDEMRVRKDVDDDRRRLKLHRQSGMLCAESSGSAMEDVVDHVSNEKFKEDFDGPARLQRKNSVFKVMVSKHKPANVLGRSNDLAEARPGVVEKKKLTLSRNILDEDRHGSRLGDANKKKKVTQSSSFSDFKRPRRLVASKSKEETNESGASLQFKSSSMRPCRKLLKKNRTINLGTENVTKAKGKEGKSKRVPCTEKQLLREKIKKMLFGAGWTIDYRPRKNRDYQDSVYISPTGNGYWSITKAYEAFQKEEKAKSQTAGDFTPLPNEILVKLTRQTQKKIEREMKKNRRHEGSIRKAKKASVKTSTQQVASDQHREKLGDSGDSDTNSSDNSDIVKASVCTNSHIVQGRKSRKIGKCTLLVRGSNMELNSENNAFVPCSRKRTMISWLIDSEKVGVGEKVKYMNLRRARVMQEGWITNDGIHCGCCSKIVTILKFELHAGSKLVQPFQNIFIESGETLMQCQINAWNKQEESERKGFHGVDVDGDDPNDDTCGLCGDGGDLICCDGCPSTFHLSCLDLQMLPQGDWHCPNCACKYCGIVGGNCTKARGRNGSSLLTCCLCEKKYHKSCSPEMDDKAIDSNDLNFCFCGRECRELYIRLQKLLCIRHKLDSGFSWSLIRRSDPLPDVTSAEFSQKVECNSKLAIALLVMDECFLPIVDRRSGITLLRNVVYNCGSNFSRLNYSGFFTAILEQGDELVCAASIRIHGTQLAEMPFIGTRHIYRRQGMCRRLFHAIESALSSLKVEKLVIPAIAEHVHTWTNAFGFKPLEESHKQEMRSMNMLVFPGTNMLQKPLLKRGKKRVEVKDYNTLLAKRPEWNYTTIQNGDKSIRNCSKPATTFSGKAHSDSNVAEDGIETTDSDSKVKTIDLDGASCDNRSLGISCQLTATDSVSVDANSDSIHV